MNFTFRPIVTWPGVMTKARRKSPFSASYNRTIDDLDRELRHLSARNAVVQLALGERDIRRDGLPYADARPAHPGVIVSFDSPHGPLSYPCDTYVDWTQNLRAIGLALEALRAINRYGVTRRGEQYTGWKALPGPLITPPAMSVEEAARLLAQMTGHDYTPLVIIASPDSFRGAYRAAALKFHPDKNGGRDVPEWKTLQDVNQVLYRHHKLDGD